LQVGVLGVFCLKRLNMHVFPQGGMTGITGSAKTKDWHLPTHITQSVWGGFFLKRFWRFYCSCLLFLTKTPPFFNDGAVVLFSVGRFYLKQTENRVFRNNRPIND
jgi:hypothetical protein